MEFTFLGTSSGVPTKHRNVSGLALRELGKRLWVLIDCGEGTQQQLQHTPHTLVNLECIFITHVHGDHCYGLPGLIASAAMAGRSRPLPIVAPPGVQRFVEAAIANTDMHLSYELEFINIESDSPNLLKSLECSFKVESIELSHRVRSFAYRFEQKIQNEKLDIHKLEEIGLPKGKAWGDLMKNGQVVLEDKRILKKEDYVLKAEKPQAIVVGGDNDTPELLEGAMKGAQALIHEATYTQDVCDKVGPQPMHSSAKKVADFAAQNKIKNLVLTHFSARYHRNKNSENSIYDLENEARHNYKGNLFLANDLDCFQLTKTGELVLVSV